MSALRIGLPSLSTAVFKKKYYERNSERLKRQPQTDFKEHGFCYDINVNQCESNAVRCILHSNSPRGCGQPANCPPDPNGNPLFFFPAPDEQ